MARKFRNRAIPRGILIDRGYVHIRIFFEGRKFQKCIGRAADDGVLDEAIAKLNQYREQIRLGKFGLEEKQRRVTFERAADTYWELHGSKKKSFRSYRLSLDYLKKFFRDRYVDTITYVDVQNYRRHRERLVQPNSVNKEHTVLTHLFNKLKEWKRLRVIENVRLPEENPGPLVRKTSERLFTRKRVLTREEFERFMKAAPLQVRRVVLGAIHTTLRFKDLRNLSRDNVNPATHQLEGIQAKTGKPYAVPINGVVEKLIATVVGPKIFDCSNFRKQFEEARDVAGLKNFEFRDLRRTGADMMRKKGIDLATISAYLGHASLSMTENYLAVTHEDKKIGGVVLGTAFRWEPSAPSIRTVVKTVVRAKKTAAARS